MHLTGVQGLYIILEDGEFVIEYNIGPNLDSFSALMCMQLANMQNVVAECNLTKFATNSLLLQIA